MSVCVRYDLQGGLWGFIQNVFQALRNGNRAVRLGRFQLTIFIWLIDREGEAAPNVELVALYVRPEDAQRFFAPQATE